MSFLTYTRDIPDGPNNPSQDQPKMKINNNSIDSLIEIDHYGFNDNQGDYHNIIHQPPTTDPVAIAGIGQTYVKSYTPDTTGGVPDTQLYSITGLGGISQLTGNLATTDGWVWAGGILLQWGQVVSALAAGSVTFKDRVPGAIPFPNNIFNVQLTATIGAATPTSNSLLMVVRTTTLSTTSFSWRINTTSGDITGLYWFAIGN